MTTKVMECDLLVLGAGGSGLVAAVRANDLCGKKVIVLEKSRKPAGCTYFAGGMGESGPIRDSARQKEAGHEVSETPDVSGQFFDWLMTKGDAKNCFTVAGPGQGGRMGSIGMKNMKGKYMGKPDETIGPGGLGSWMVDTMTGICKEQGIQVLTDDRGRVTAVVADTPDGQLLVNCKACIVAAGGYGANKKLLKKYYPGEFDGGKMHSLCPPAMTGDCILAAGEIGAYVDPTVRGLDFPGGFYGEGFLRHPWNTSILALATGKCVIVNLEAKRWQNEADASGGDIRDQRSGIGVAIVDSTIVKALGSEPIPGMPGMESKPADSIRADLEKEAAWDEAGAVGNHTKKADSLVELALKMKVDPRALVDTIERYNTFCETGKDLDFGKPAAKLQKIEKAPFYAIFGNRWSQSTKGRNGIAVDSKFQALNTKGEVIPGLYAVGDGCTIFGGGTLNYPDGGHGTISAEEEAGRAALSKELARVFAPETAPQGGMPPGGGMPMMGGGEAVNPLETKGAPCGGLGPAFLSGFCAGTYAAKYLMDL